MLLSFEISKITKFIETYQRFFALKYLIFRHDHKGDLKCFENPTDSKYPEAVHATTELFRAPGTGDYKGLDDF